MPAPVEFVVMGAMLPGRRVTRPHLRRMSAARISGSMGGAMGADRIAIGSGAACAGAAPLPTPADLSRYPSNDRSALRMRHFR
jgi:hypothetical protein